MKEIIILALLGLLIYFGYNSLFPQGRPVRAVVSAPAYRSREQPRQEQMYVLETTEEIVEEEVDEE